MLVWWMFVFFFCKHKTAYEMRISDWSSDVCSSDLLRSPTTAPSKVMAYLALYHPGFLVDELRVLAETALESNDTVCRLDSLPDYLRAGRDDSQMNWRLDRQSVV